MRRIPVALILVALILLAPAGIPAQGDPDAAVTITVVACPDGIDPGAFTDQCTQTRNLPRETRLVLPGSDGETDLWVKSLNNASVQGDTWLVENLPANVPIKLGGIEPSGFTFFHVDGATPAHEFGWMSTFTLDPGETHAITVYVWNGPEGPITPARNDLVVRTFACPEGVDPQVDRAACATPIPVPGGLTVGGVSRGEDAMPGPISAYETEPGAYHYPNLPTYTMVSVSFHDAHDTGYGAPTVIGADSTYEERYFLAHLIRGETRELSLYFPLETSATPAP